MVGDPRDRGLLARLVRASWSLLLAQKDPPPAMMDALKERCLQLPEQSSEQPYFLARLNILRCRLVRSAFLPLVD